MLVEDHWKESPGRALAKANGDSSLSPTACMESCGEREGEGGKRGRGEETLVGCSHLCSSQHSGGSYGDPDSIQLHYSELNLIL